MKRNIFYLLLILIFFMGSCKEEEVQYYQLGSEFFVSTSGYTSLDDAAEFYIDTAFNVSSIDVVRRYRYRVSGVKMNAQPEAIDLGTITIADGKGDISVLRADLGIDTIKNKADIRFIAIADDGTAMNRDLTLTVTDPIAITRKPVMVQKDTLESFKFSIKPKLATVTVVNVQTKTNYNGTYVDVVKAYNPAKDSIQLNGSLYNVGDTIYVKLTGSTAAPRTAVTITKLAVGVYKYPKTATVKLTPSTTTSIYNLVERKFIKNADEVANGDKVDLKYLHTDITGGFTLGFTAPQNAEFVKVTGTAAQIAAVFDAGNFVTTAATDFSSAVTSVDNVAVGDVYLYRTFRGANPYVYGMFKITAVSKPEGVAANSSFTFELKNK